MPEDIFVEVDLSEVPPDLIEWAQQQAVIRGVTFDDVLNEALVHFRNNHDPNRPPRKDILETANKLIKEHQSDLKYLEDH